MLARPEVMLVGLGYLYLTRLGSPQGYLVYVVEQGLTAQEVSESLTVPN